MTAVTVAFSLPPLSSAPVYDPVLRVRLDSDESCETLFLPRRLTLTYVPSSRPLSISNIMLRRRVPQQSSFPATRACHWRHWQLIAPARVYLHLRSMQDRRQYQGRRRRRPPLHIESGYHPYAGV